MQYITAESLLSALTSMMLVSEHLIYPSGTVALFHTYSTVDTTGNSICLLGSISQDKLPEQMPACWVTLYKGWLTQRLSPQGSGLDGSGASFKQSRRNAVVLLWNRKHLLRSFNKNLFGGRTTGKQEKINNSILHPHQPGWNRRLRTWGSVMNEALETKIPHVTA